MLKKLVGITILFSILCSPEVYAKSTIDVNQQAETEPNKPDSGGDSIDRNLSKAVFSLDVNGVQQALKAGANPNARIGSLSAVEMAIISIPPLKGEIYRKDEDKKWIKDKEKKCIETLEKLLNAGAKVEQSYLRWPIEHNSVLILKLLLQRGTDINTPMGELTPIELAVKSDSQDVIDFLIKQGVQPVSPQNAAQLSLLDASENHDIFRMEKSIAEGAKLDCGYKNIRVNALIIAVSSIGTFESESYGAIAYLLQKGANPNFEEPNHNTPLHFAMISTKIYLYNNNDMTEQQQTYRKLSLQALVKAGANISSQNAQGQTPLHVATMWDNLLGAKFLIENGASVNIRDKDGKTPLDYAKSPEMIKLLKSHDAKEK